MKHFHSHIAIRLILFAAFVVTTSYFFFQKDYVLGTILCFISLLSAYSIYYFLLSTNRKLQFFFESIQYSDFTIKFTADNKQGKSFKELNKEMNKVVEAFKQARSEKEANTQFLHTLVQHMEVGIISFDKEEKIELVNNAALRLLDTYRLRYLEDLEAEEHTELLQDLRSLEGNISKVYTTSNGSQLAVKSAKINIKGKPISILTLQNIRTELQEKEINSWQNLTKVLRHEIMNSIAPIVSLAGTMRSIVKEDLKPELKKNLAVEDLEEALETIENRGKGIMNFVNAYREFTSLPEPQKETVQITEFVQEIISLTRQSGWNVVTEFKDNFSVVVDKAQLEMVLLNLVKNAAEASETKQNGRIEIISEVYRGKKFLTVKDNGIGMIPEAIDKVFIPFFTTKKTGQGIGLSLSRQIMQNHGGDIQIKSKPEVGTEVLLNFG